MNRQHNKENDGGLGSNALGGEIEPKSKRIKLDDPNIQPVKRNQVDDEEAHSHSSTRVRPFERKSEEPFVPFLEDVEEPEMSAFDYMMSQLRPKWQQELAKRGIDIKTLEQANWEGTCGSCGDVDKHETLDCPYAEFIDACPYTEFIDT